MYSFNKPFKVQGQTYDAIYFIELTTQPLRIIVQQTGESAKVTVHVDAVCDAARIEGYFYEEHKVGKQYLRWVTAIGKVEIEDLVFPRVYTIKALVTCIGSSIVPKYFRQEIPIIGLGECLFTFSRWLIIFGLKLHNASE